MFEIFISSYPTLLKATIVTLQLTLTSLVLGSLIGLLFAFFRISNNKVLNSIAHVYIAIIRGTPLIVQIAILYFGITSVVVFTPFWAGAIALAIHNGAYITEIFRGSIQSVDRGQLEAARLFRHALSFSYATNYITTSISSVSSSSRKPIYYRIKRFFTCCLCRNVRIMGFRFINCSR